MKFSIVTATYNRAKLGYLEKCIESVRNQEPGHFEYEHIIIDDGSIDNTKEIIEKYQKKDRRIKYFYKKNGDTASAWKFGISKASGDFITFLDDDDILPFNSLKIRAEFINQNNMLDWFFANNSFIDDEDRDITFDWVRPRIFNMKHLYEQILIQNDIPGGTLVAKTDILRDIIWPSWVKRSQDYFIYLELLRQEKNLKFSYFNENVYCYRWHDNMHTKQYFNDYSKKERINFKVRSLHPENLVYLSSELYEYKKAIIKKKDLEKELNVRIQDKEIIIDEKVRRIKELEENLASLYGSIFVSNALRIRNVVRRSRNLSLRIIRYAIRKLGLRYLKFRIYKNNKKWEGPLVTVITSFYNQSDTILETVKSVLDQSFINFEYIIVNDGSGFKERKILNKITDKRVKIIDFKENQGQGSPAAARNIGLKEAKGKYVMCLDGDDMLEPTYLEKTVSVLETNHNIDIVGTDMKMFGNKDNNYSFGIFNAQRLFRQNFFSHASLFRKRLLEKSGGFKKGIGYEDWEFWINLVEKGAVGLILNENLFLYRVLPDSRYKDDTKKHRENFLKIVSLHRFYRIRVLLSNLKRSVILKKIKPKTAFINVEEKSLSLNKKGKKQVLIALPWMTFGGAETLVYNFASNLKEDHDFHFVTGIKDDHEWEYKFREITESIYHLPNLFEDEEMKLAFLLNFIKTRKIDVMHIVHNACFYKMLPKIKENFPNIKIINTLFNTRADHFKECQKYDKYFDFHTSDNTVAIKEIKKTLGGDNKRYFTIPNGIDCNNKFNQIYYNREGTREELGLKKDDCAIFFIGRLSKEKGPDIFIEIAKKVLIKNPKAKFFIIGDGPMRSEIEKMMKDLGLQDLKYLGYKSDPERYLSASDVFLLTSEIEGFPLSNVEAMAMKNVVVASDVGGVSDAIINGENGILVDPPVAENFIKSLENLIDDTILREKISQAARKSVEEKFSIETLADNYKELYSK